MQLTQRDRSRLARASALMLRPFERIDTVEYLNAVAQTTLALVQGTAAISGTSSHGGMHFRSSQYTGEALTSFAAYGLADEGMQRAIGTGCEVVNQTRVVNGQWDLYAVDPMVVGWYRVHDVHDVIAYILHWPENDAIATIEHHHRTQGSARFGERGIALLELLLPSLRAGLGALHALGAYYERIARDMDALGLAVAVCSSTGKLLHLSTSANQLLQRDSEREEVVRRVRGVAAAAHRASDTGVAEQRLRRPHEIVTTRDASYRLSAARASPGAQFGAGDVLVSLVQLATKAGDLARARERYRLTRREAEVAYHIARGLRNDAIARQLGISPHTARRHTEQVLGKMEVETRAGVAAAMR